MFTPLLIFIFLCVSLSSSLLASGGGVVVIDRNTENLLSLTIPSLTISFQRVVSNEGIPLAYVVPSLPDNNNLKLNRTSSIGAHLESSQHTASQGENSTTIVTTPRRAAIAEASFKPTDDSMGNLDALIVQNLFNSCNEGALTPTPQKALKNMSQRGVCFAAFAIRILYKPEMNFGMTEAEVEENFRQALENFPSYQTSNPSLYTDWMLTLADHGFLSDDHPKKE